MFLWAFKVVHVNAYLVYKAVCEKKKVRPMKRDRFLELLAEQLAVPENLQSTSPSQNQKIQSYAPRLTLNTLISFLRNAREHPLEDVTQERRCQWCRLTSDTLKMAKIRCTTCGILVCSAKCWNEIHYG